MEKIRTIHFYFLRADAHFEYLTQFKKLVDPVPQIKEIVAPQYPEFVIRLNREGELINAMKKSDYTEQIADADYRIDRCLTGINAVIVAALHHYDPTIRADAQSLQNRLRAFGRISRKSYEEESAAVSLLLADLNNPEYAAKITNVGLTTWINELNAAETTFEELFKLRYIESANKPQGRLLDAREEVEETYHTMINRISAAAILNDELTTILNKFITELNAIIVYFNSHTHRHVKKDIGAGNNTTIEPIETQTYTGKPITIIPKVYYREEGKPVAELTMGNDFSITYKNNIDVGTADLTIHGKGAYKGQKTVTFNIARSL